MQYDKNNSLSNNSNNLDYISDYGSYEDIPILNNYSNSSFSNSISSDNSIIIDYIDKNKYVPNISKNKIFERPEYVKYNILKNTYSNKKKYQIIFNKIIFNIK